ncbi:MAG TPA: hypothetical protein VFC39_10155 [Acidobacteriaceae bacterium]|nr:hypothetical protein [Acidobacteriaceae bacterium]
MIRKVLPFAAALAFTFSAAAVAQDAPVTGLDKQLSRIDFAVQGVGMFNKTVQGTIPPTAAQEAGPTVIDAPSNTLGALVTLRYVAKPYFGFEGNYGYARYTEDYSNVGGIQTQANEYTLGYIVTPPHTIFGLQPFVSAGAGSIGFRPTPRGGQGLTIQARAAYYYSAGLQKEYFSEHFGFRAGFRQLFFLAPDYGQNYLTIKQRTTTYGPSFGFYLKF